MITYFSVVFLIVLPQIIQLSNADINLTKESTKSNPARTTAEFYSVNLMNGFAGGMQFAYKFVFSDDKDANKHRIEFGDIATTEYNIDFNKYETLDDLKNTVTEMDGCTRSRSSGGIAVGSEVTVLLVLKDEKIEVVINSDLYDHFAVQSIEYMQAQPNLKIYTKSNITTMIYFSIGNGRPNTIVPEWKTLMRESKRIKKGGSKKLRVGKCMLRRTLKTFQEVAYTKLVEGFGNNKTLSIKAADYFSIALTDADQVTAFHLLVDNGKKIAIMSARSDDRPTVQPFSITKQLPDRNQQCNHNTAFDIKILRVDDDFVVYYNGWILARYTLIDIPESGLNFNKSFFHIGFKSTLKSICYENTFVGKFDPEWISDPDCEDKLANQNIFEIKKTELANDFVEDTSLTIYAVAFLNARALFIYLFYDDQSVAARLTINLEEKEKGVNNVNMVQEVSLVYAHKESEITISINNEIKDKVSITSNKAVKYFSVHGDAELIGVCQPLKMKAFLS